MNLKELSIVYFIVSAIVFVGFIVREVRWNASLSNSEDKYSRLLKDYEALMWRLQINEESCFKNDLVLTEQSSIDTNNNNESVVHHSNSKVQVFLEVSWFDRNDFILYLLTIATKLGEIYFSHPSIYPESRTMGNFSGNRLFRKFVVAYFPVSNFFVSLVLLLWGCLAWLTICSQERFVQFSLKFLLCWVMGSVGAVMISSIVRLRKYLPHTWSDWQAEMTKVHWWAWFLLRLFGLDSPQGFSFSSLIHSLLTLWCIWPFRYFYFYQHLDKLPSQQYLFLTNMVLHTVFLQLWISAVQICVFGTPKWQVPENYLTANMKVLLGTVPNLLYLAIVPIIGLAVVCGFRILWFSFYGGCSWYGALVSWMFLHAHIILIITSNPCSSVLILKNRIKSEQKEAFVNGFIESFRSHSKETENDNNADPYNNPNPITEEMELVVRELASDLFTALLHKTARNYILGGSDINYVSYDERKDTYKPEIEGDPEFDPKLSDFKLAFEETKNEFSELHTQFESTLRELEGETDDNKTVDIFAVRATFSKFLGAEI